MNILPFIAKHPDFELVPSPDLFFSSVNFDYTEFDQSGFYRRVDSPHYYIYQIKKKDRQHLGVLAGLDLEDYKKGKVLKHEHTIESKKQETIQKTLKRGAMIKPILLGYPNRKKINSLLSKYIQSNKPLIDTTIKKNNEIHQIWKISDPKTSKSLAEHFSIIDHVYIADGHHRSATMEILSRQKIDLLNTKQIYCALFPFEDLDIHAYNRVIDYEPTLKKTHFIAKLSQYCDITILEKYKIWPKKEREFVLLMNYEYYYLRWKKNLLQKEKNKLITDSYLFNKYIMNNILNITDVRHNPNITYIRGTKGPEGVMDAVQKTEFRLGFILHPLAKRTFIRTAYNGNILPPKSTWFEPRMRNGILVMDLTHKTRK